MEANFNAVSLNQSNNLSFGKGLKYSKGYKLHGLDLLLQVDIK